MPSALRPVQRTPPAPMEEAAPLRRCGGARSDMGPGLASGSPGRSHQVQVKYGERPVARVGQWWRSLNIIMITRLTGQSRSACVQPEDTPRSSPLNCFRKPEVKVRDGARLAGLSPLSSVGESRCRFLRTGLALSGQCQARGRFQRQGRGPRGSRTACSQCQSRTDQPGSTVGSGITLRRAEPLRKSCLNPNSVTR